MANEITGNFSLACYKPSVMKSSIGRFAPGLQISMAGNFYEQGSVLIATTVTAIPLGQVSAPHVAWFANLDATNYVTIRNGAAGTDLLQLFPGEAFPVPLLSTCIPYAIANVAACLLEYLILSL